MKSRHAISFSIAHAKSCALASAKQRGELPSSPASQEKPAHPEQRGNPAPERAYEIINKTLSISPDESLRMELDAIVELGERRIDAKFDSQFFPGGEIQEGNVANAALKRSCTPP